MGFRMKTKDNSVSYVLKGTSQDVESIIRLRPWMEDEIKEKYEFSSTKLYTDYKQETETFEFKIVFIK
jgi:hypothetical protein